jgi:hydroxymethylglutaryl-CoA lyase
VRTLGFPYSISETFLRKNQNQSAEENSEALEAVWRKAEENGLEMVAYVSMAFGNPYGDPWDVDEVLQAVREYRRPGHSDGFAGGHGGTGVAGDGGRE